MGELFAEFGLLRGGGFERAGFASDEGEHLRQVLRLDEHFAGLRASDGPTTPRDSSRSMSRPALAKRP